MLSRCRERRGWSGARRGGERPDAGDPFALRGGRGGLVADAPSLDPLYSTARIALAPLRLGGGTRFKVIEAMARGAAVVATETASEALDVDPGRDLLVATDQAQFVESCVSLLRDPGRAAELGARARETWARGYSSTGRRSRSSRSSSEC